MGACPIMDVHPPDVHERLPDAGPGPCAGDERDRSRGASRPRHQEAGARARVRHDRVGGGQCVAVHARTAPGAGRAQGRRGIPGGLARELAHPREVTAVCAATPCGLAGAIAAVAHTPAVVRRTPAYQARQQQPGQVHRGLLTSPVQPSPRWGTGQGHDHREGPGPSGERPLDEPRHDDPCMPPALGRIPVGRAPAITLPSLATHARPGRLSDRSVACQEHWARWDDMVQQARDQPARQPPSDHRRGEQTR
jgi:hypothetical protein